MPAAPAGKPASGPRSLSDPSAAIAHAPTVPLLSRAYRKWLLRLSARSVTPVPGAAARPSAARIVRLPSVDTAYEVTEPPAFPAYANRPLPVTAIQQAAVSVVGTDALTVVSASP